MCGPTSLHHSGPGRWPAGLAATADLHFTSSPSLFPSLSPSLHSPCSPSLPPSLFPTPLFALPASSHTLSDPEQTEREITQSQLSAC